MAEKVFKLNPEIITNLLFNQLLARECPLDLRLRFDRDKKIPIIIDRNECKILDESHEALVILYRVAEIIKRKEDIETLWSKTELLSLPYANARASLKSLSVRPGMHVRDPIKSFAFKSDDCLTYCRIPFDPLSEILPTPTWDNLLQNFTNTDAVKMWIGSLFDMRSDRSQYLWIYGKGGNGKSTLAIILSQVLGSFVRFEQAPSKDDKYWTHGLIGKRLIVLDDCNNYGFVRTGLFKALTGGSKVRVERKFGDPYDIDLDCKFLFTSNELPNISSDLADTRRIILSTSTSKDSFSFDGTFRDSLKAEIPQFVSNCVAAYVSACSDGRPIPTQMYEVKELIEQNEGGIEGWVNSCFNFTPGAVVSVSNMRYMINLTNFNYRQVYSFLERKGVEKTRIGHDNLSVFRGIQKKLSFQN